MIHKIMFAGDLHKRPKDITTIKGYVACLDKVQDDILKVIHSIGITHFVSLGDWYDKGYLDDVASALADTSREELFNKVLNGNFYGVIGNHIRLGMDSNPELMLIQPHSTLKPRKQVKRDIPIIKTPDYFMVGPVQVSLVHNIPGAARVGEYVIHRDISAKYHIACVHDALFIPNSQLSKTPHPPTKSTENAIAVALSNVDLCICGDIHMPLGLFDISPTTKMYVPGSLTNTNSSKAGRHSVIHIPIVTVDDELGSYGMEFLEFDCSTNMLTFDDRAAREAAKSSKLSTIRGNSIQSLYDDNQTIESAITTGIASMTLSLFLESNNYRKADKDMIRSVIRNPQDINALVKIFAEDMGGIEE